LMLNYSSLIEKSSGKALPVKQKLDLQRSTSSQAEASKEINFHQSLNKSKNESQNQLESQTSSCNVENACVTKTPEKVVEPCVQQALSSTKKQDSSDASKAQPVKNCNPKSSVVNSSVIKERVGSSLVKIVDKSSKKRKTASSSMLKQAETSSKDSIKDKTSSRNICQAVQPRKSTDSSLSSYSRTAKPKEVVLNSESQPPHEQSFMDTTLSSIALSTYQGALLNSVPIGIQASTPLSKAKVKRNREGRLELKSSTPDGIITSGRDRNIQGIKSHVALSKNGRARKLNSPIAAINKRQTRAKRGADTASEADVITAHISSTQPPSPSHTNKLPVSKLDGESKSKILKSDKFAKPIGVPQRIRIVTRSRVKKLVTPDPASEDADATTKLTNDKAANMLTKRNVRSKKRSLSEASEPPSTTSSEFSKPSVQLSKPPQEEKRKPAVKTPKKPPLKRAANPTKRNKPHLKRLTTPASINKRKKLTSEMDNDDGSMSDFVVAETAAAKKPTKVKAKERKNTKASAKSAKPHWKRNTTPARSLFNEKSKQAEEGNKRAPVKITAGKGTMKLRNQLQAAMERLDERNGGQDLFHDRQRMPTGFDSDDELDIPEMPTHLSSAFCTPN
ncbi:MAG: hypothetical protein AAFO91_04250, partial [Bacteroidota bacterium]